ncbi:ATP-grasp domain-containing protein [Acetobacter fallax]|uniref:ATP-grasp domain-containing protein n=1 Tax=Acetobacter fallax TaxID=1737473 RepID=UPI001F553D6D|nr:ATP-grasp domain-containing protein [Acetobacter fallax]
MESDFTVLVIASVWWSSVTRAAVECIESGVTVHAICPSGHSLRCLKGIATFRDYPCVSSIRMLEGAIMDTKPDLIVPADDRVVRALHRVYNASDAKTARGKRCREVIETSLGSPDCFSYAQTRMKLIDTLREEGIPTPAAMDLATVDDVRGWCRGRPGPWVLKRDQSWGGCGVVIADTVQEAESSFRRLSQPPGVASALRTLLSERDVYSFREALVRRPGSVMAQAYVAGMPANIMLACQEGKIIGSLGVDVVSFMGRTGAATVIEVTQSADMERAARVVCARLKLSGFFGLDFVRCAATGTYHFIEMNPRLTQTGHLRHGGSTLVRRLLQRFSGGSAVTASGHGGDVSEHTLVALFPAVV